MTVHVCCPQDLFPPEEQPGFAGDSLPSVPCVWDKQEPLWSWGKEKDLGSAAELLWGAAHILLPRAALICPALLMQPSISREQGDPHSDTQNLLV